MAATILLQDMPLTRAQQTEIALTHFRAGITGLLRTWPALKTAVQNEWGGLESHDKAEDLRTNIFDNYDGSKSEPMTIEALEDNLLLYLEEEFSVVLEDESERQIANVICELYKECSSGNTQMAERLVRLSIEEGEKNVNQTATIMKGDIEMDSDDESVEIIRDTIIENSLESNHANIADMNSNTKEPSITDFQYNIDIAKSFTEGPLFPGGRAKKFECTPNLPPPRQLGEPEPERPTVQMDENGFAPVQSRRSRRNKKSVQA